MTRPAGGDRAESGFTLIEVVITSAILLVAVTAALSVLVAVQRTSAFSTARGQTQDDVRLGMDQLTKDLRQLTRFRTSFTASSGCNTVASGTYTGCDLDFDTYTPANADKAVRVHWWLSGSTLWREEYRTDGSSASKVAVLQAVTPSGGGTPPVFQGDVPLDSDAPREITVTLTVDLANPGGTYSTQSQTQLRNLNPARPIP